MPPKKAKQSLQPFTFQIFDDIDGDFCDEEVLVRLIHFWEARNFKRGNILMGLELLLIDSQSNAVQGFISANRLFPYEEHLKRNSIYKLKKFMITPAKKIYKVSDHKHGICFTEKTSMVNVTLGDHQIDEQKFRFRNFEEFSAIVDTNIDLFDIIGQLRLITGDNLHSPTTMETAPHVEGNRSSDRVFLHLLLKDETIRIYLWGNIAASFRERWNKSEVKPTVLLLTTVNPKTIGATVSLSSTSSTRLFFDTDVDETKQFFTWLGDNCKTTPTIASSSSAVTKLETVTINEIHQFLQNANPQEVSFTCFTTVLDILPQYGWYYISCSICNNKLEKADTSMYCNTCKEYNNVGLVSSSEIYFIIKRPRTDQSDIVVQIPYTPNGEASTWPTLRSTLQFLLTYHQIQESEATRMTSMFLQFLNAIHISTESENETAKRVPTTSEENEDCAICLETIKGRDDINNLACNHIYHNECIVTWLYAKKKLSNM
ncbi:hypothetical protein ISN45_Aa04g016930 [Arabidopsis thaliana x Arabidopsis arenosa]|uniref:RING-type domain-containing protein n=1 Tax=Arabidopsis thaliana x Arabidopsis arenosa TaxID=1240361 RepID=A0A8T2AB70_9BRAS|nr:hypothetical protein ISN45_Aa04g016930 [Arabidopsis thaliana x Arabidopsis arenosa]